MMSDDDDSPHREVIQKLQCLCDYQLASRPVFQVSDTVSYTKDKNKMKAEKVELDIDI